MSLQSTTSANEPTSVVIGYPTLYPLSSSVSASLAAPQIYSDASFTSDAHLSLTTSHISFYKRATSSEDNDSASKSSSSHRSSTSACNDKQRCQTGSNLTGKTVGLAVGIPLVVFLSIIGFFLYKNYRKGRKEALDDNDPDFYGETTVLPDYPKPHGFPDDDSFTSNPFGTENNRYPSNTVNPPQNAHIPDNRSILTARADPYYEPFNLPYQHNIGSKQSLDEYAKHLHRGYSGYEYSRPDSRAASNVNSSYKSANSSVMNLSSQQAKKPNEKTFSKENPTTDSSTSSREAKHYNNDSNSDNHFTFAEADREKALKALESNDNDYHRYDQEEEEEKEPEDIFQDPYQTTPKKHIRTGSDFSNLDTTPENFKHKESKVKKDVRISSPVKEPEDEEDEDIKRMKSVYRVYFDRENSIKSVRTQKDGSDGNEQGQEEEHPPLPNLEDSLPQAESTRLQNQSQLTYNEDEYDGVGEVDAADAADQLRENYLNVNGNMKTFDAAEKSRRAVSSIYSSIPLPQEYQDQYQHQHQHQPQAQTQPHHYQQQPYQQQRIPQQLPPQLDTQHIYQPPFQQQNQQRYPSAPSSPNLQILKPLQTVPTPNKMNYDSIITNTDYAPTKSLTGGSRPDIPVKPFNPLHYSDQIFQPTSPLSPSNTGGFQNYKEFQGPNISDAVPPSPHHIRQSIVMVNPVEIGKQKIYRPAGSFTQYQQQTGGSRNGSMTSQSQYNAAYGPPQSPQANEFAPPSPGGKKDGELPRSGSQADLRKQLGSSDNYNFL